MPDLLERLNTALAGRYAIERELGRGGMATVYLAHDSRAGPTTTVIDPAVVGGVHLRVGWGFLVMR